MHSLHHIIGLTCSTIRTGFHYIGCIQLMIAVCFADGIRSLTAGPLFAQCQWLVWVLEWQRVGGFCMQWEDMTGRPAGTRLRNTSLTLTPGTIWHQWTQYAVDLVSVFVYSCLQISTAPPQGIVLPLNHQLSCNFTCNVCFICAGKNLLKIAILFYDFVFLCYAKLSYPAANSSFIYTTTLK